MRRYPWNCTFLHRRSLFMLTSFQSLFIDHCIKLCCSNRKLLPFSDSSLRNPSQSPALKGGQNTILKTDSKLFNFSDACSQPVHPSVVMKTTKLVTREGERLLPQEDLLQVRLIFVWSLHLHIVLLQE